MKKWLILIVLAQLSIIGVLGYKIHKKRSTVLGTAQANPIDKKQITTGTSETFSFFYEPQANTVFNNLNQWAPYMAENTINADALNERFDYTAEKPANTFRIITLGDSFTYGQYVETKENWTERLEDLFSQASCSTYERVEVINLGVYGYDIPYSIERLRLRGMKYQPDLLLWLWKQDDITQLNEVMLKKERYYYEQYRKSGELERQSKLGNYYPSWDKAREETEKELGEGKIQLQLQSHLKTFSQLYSGPLVLINYENESKEGKLFTADVAKRRKHTYLFADLINTFDNDEYHFENDGHPSAKGHKLMAQDIFEYLTKNKLISCE